MNLQSSLKEAYYQEIERQFGMRIEIGDLILGKQKKPAIVEMIYVKDCDVNEIPIFHVIYEYKDYRKDVELSSIVENITENLGKITLEDLKKLRPEFYI